MLCNGAFWGQCDSLWSMFLVLCVYQFMSGRNGVIALRRRLCGQGAGSVLRPLRAWHADAGPPAPFGLLSVPLVYLAFAAPGLIAGRGLSGVASVHLAQGDTFHLLSANAASVWALVPYAPYRLGVAIGPATVAAGGLWLAATTARSPQTASASFP